MASDERLGRTMLFPLAERMVIKFINEDKIEAEAGNVSEQQGVSFIICDVPINETAYCFYNNIIIVVKILQKSPSREFILDGISFLTLLNSTLVNYCKVQSALEMHLVSSVMIKNFFCLLLHPTPLLLLLTKLISQYSGNSTLSKDYLDTL